MKRLTSLCLLSLTLCLSPPAAADSAEQPQWVTMRAALTPGGLSVLAAADAPMDSLPGMTQPTAQAVQATASPQPPAVLPQPDADLAAFALALLTAASNRQWPTLAALLLLGAVAALRRFGAAKWPWLATDRGGALLSLLGGFAVALGAAAAAPGAASVWSVLLTALLTSVTASGTYALVRKLLWPSGSERAQEIQVAAAVVAGGAGGAAAKINGAVGG